MTDGKPVLVPGRECPKCKDTEDPDTMSLVLIEEPLIDRETAVGWCKCGYVWVTAENTPPKEVWNFCPT